MKLLLYGNGGSANHGCEAIVRGTAALLGKNHTYTIYSANVEEDLMYGLQQLVEVKEAKSDVRHDLSFARAYLKMKLFHNYTEMDGLYYLPSIRDSQRYADIALSVGGDNYCYSNASIYAYLNKAYHDYGIKTVLWGCSVEPDVVKQKDVSRDLTRYNLVVARESITYQAISQINPNTVLAPDPAFFMKPVACKLNDNFFNGNVIGINISPMIVSNEKVSGITLDNYRNLMRYILKNTDSNIVLIPHVVWQSNDDRVVLRELHQEFKDSERVLMVEDHTAPELKYIISKCRIFAGARTHATIAAYSSCVPTLVIGYSVKARGIAKDLFGKENSCILPVQDLRDCTDLERAFKEVWDNESRIRDHLTRLIPDYIKGGDKAIEALQRV